VRELRDREGKPMPAPYNVLFLCTGNSARSILAECALRRWGQGRFVAFSAGSHPTGSIHPMALQLLRDLQCPTDGLRSKSWDEFARPESPRMDFIFTVCDKAAGEACPVWPGEPVSAHWGVEDPAAFVGPMEKQQALFNSVYRQLDARVKLLVNLRIEDLDQLSLRLKLSEIGKSTFP
jgi:protein-tyrosine-phosphatase